MKKFDFFLARLNKIKGLQLLQSAFPVKKTHTQTLSWLVDFIGTSYDPITSSLVLKSMSFQTTVSCMTMN